jgi:predicted nucleic acid-binding protein
LSRFVLDASVALGWIADEPPSPYALKIKQDLLSEGRAVVPTLWHLEMASWFAIAARRRVIDESQQRILLSALDGIIARAIETEVSAVSVRHALTTANHFQLSAYDAAYLDLALRERLPLATLDQKLRAAASKANVELLQ